MLDGERIKSECLIVGDFYVLVIGWLEVEKEFMLL